MAIDDLEQLLRGRNATRFQLGPNRNVVQRNLERPGRYELRFQHVPKEKDHHAGVQLVVGAPAPPRRHRLSEESKHVEVGHQGDDHQQLRDQQDLREVHVETGRVIVSTADRNLRVLFVDDVVVLVECLAITAGIAVQESHRRPVAADILAELGDGDLLFGTSANRCQAQENNGHTKYRKNGKVFHIQFWPHPGFRGAAPRRVRVPTLADVKLLIGLHRLSLFAFFL